MKTVDRYTGLREAAREVVRLLREHMDTRTAIERLGLALDAAPTFTDPAPNRVVLTVEGGIVQSVGADRPTELDVVVVDFDVDGSDHPSIIELPREEGEPFSASRAGVDHYAELTPLVPSETRWLDALAKREAAV